MADRDESARSQTFQIYGRKKYGEPLTFLRTLEIVGAADPKEECRKALGGDPWVELVAIPESALISVIDEGSEK